MTYDFLLLLRNPFLRKRALKIWASWILLTMMGWFVAGLTSLPIGRVVMVEGGISAILSVAGSMSLIGALIGGLASTGQWFFLRYRSSRAYLWVLSTSLGWGLGLPFALLVNFLFGLGISAGLYGLFVGAGVAMMQWVVCRNVLPSFTRWLPVNLLAFVLAISGAGWIERYMLQTTAGQWGGAAWQTGLTSSLAGAIVGFVTGIVLTVRLIGNNQEGQNAQ